MKKYGVNELRRMYLDFFKSKDHLVMKSFSLIPHNDNSLLLINAGMAPLKPYFTENTTITHSYNNSIAFLPCKAMHPCLSFIWKKFFLFFHLYHIRHKAFFLRI